MWVGTVLSCTLVVLILFVCPTGHVLAAITDQYGNHVSDNGTITWVPIPVGNATYVTTSYYDDGGLGMIFAFARSFINTVQPNGFPYEVLTKVLNGTFSIGDNYMELVQYSMGFAICFAVGLIFVVFLPLCGCCICCCRCCCSNCGGDLKAVYNKNEDCKRMGLAQALFMMAVLMAGAAGCVWMTNGRFTTAIDYTESQLLTNMDDIITFFNNLMQQFIYMAVDMYNLVHKAIMADIDDLGTVLESAIFDNLGIDAVVDAVIELDTSIRNISLALATVISDQDTLVTAADDLTTAMDTLGTAIDTTKSTCNLDSSACQTACDTFDTTALKSGSVDFSTLPDMTSVQTSIDDVVAMNLTGIAQTAKSAIDDVSSVVNAQTSAVKDTINGTMSDFAVTIETMIDELTATLNSTIELDPIKEDVRGMFGMLSKYDGYRVYFGYGLTGLFTIMVAMTLLGICCGCLGHDRDKLPTERGFMSNTGGCILIIPVLLMFVVGSLLMLLTTLTFMVGGNMEKLCQPMIDLSLFRDFVDTGAISGFSIGLMLHGNASYDLGIYDLLLGCRANRAPFTLLGLNQILPLEDYLNHSQYTGNLSGQMSSVSSIDLTSFSILTPDMETALTDLQSSGLSDIDFASINSTLSQPLVSVDWAVMISAMTAIRDSCSGSSYTSWNNHISSTGSIRDNEYPAVETAQTNLKDSVAVLEGLIGGLDAKINNTLDTARTADDQLANNVTAVLTQAIEDFVARIIRYVDQYGAEAVNIVYYEIGRCLPIWNMYDSFTSSFCNYMVESLNAFWFGTGWGLLFFIPVMVMSMKLSKYYRKMDSQEGYKDEEEPMDEDIDDFAVRYDMMQRHNKVAPDPDFYD